MSTSAGQPFERRQAKTLVSRLREPRRYVQVVAGARQVDKTTLVEGDGISLDEFLIKPVEHWLQT